MGDDETEAPMFVGGITLAPPGWKAHFKSVPDEDEPSDDEGEEVGEEDEPPTAKWTAHDVIAFDAEGNALIVDQTRGRLVPANSYSDFAHVQPMDEGPLYSAFLPGGGWRLAHGKKGQEPQVRDVVAWAITAWGDAAPIHVDPCGEQDYVWAVVKSDPEYAHLKYIPPAHVQPTVQPTVQPNGRPHGRATGQPNGLTVGGDGSAHVGGTMGEAMGGEAPAHRQPIGRKKVQPTRQPKGSPNGRAKRQPMRTPTIDDLSPAERDRLRILGEHFPDEVPGRDAVCEYMRTHGIAGFGNKGRTQVLVQVLSASRAQFAQMTEQEVKA